MFDSELRLRHLPFFEELASREEGNSEWRAAAAGLMVMRLVDSWLDDRRSEQADGDWAIRSVEAAIEELDEGWPGRALLSRIVEALLTGRNEIATVVPTLMAYAQVLEYDARWAMAADVYQSILARVHPVEEADASVAAHLRLGHCYATLNQAERATRAFADAGEIANRVGDLVGVLRARIGEGRTAMFAGNLPLAEHILDDTVTRAEQAHLSQVRSRALHVRSNVAHFRGQYDLAVQLAYRALEDAPSQINRDRILNDLAASFLDLGILSAARDAYLILSVTAQEQFLRWAATLNLLEVAWRAGSEPLFEGYRGQLIAVDLPPRLATGFALSQGRGFQRFGHLTKAQRYLTNAVALAREHGLNQFLFEAEEALSSLGPSAQRTPPVPMTSLEVREIADAVGRMREMAGVD